MPSAKKEKKKKEFRYFDYTLLFIIIFLVGFGLVMLYSTSSYSAATKFGDSAFYLKKQLFAASVGMGAMIFMSIVDYHLWMKLYKPIYLGALALCTYVLFMGKELNGSARWIDLGFISFQPSELAKIALIIVMAAVINKMPNQMNKLSVIFKVLLFFTFPLVGLVGTANLSTAVIILGIGMTMTFVSSGKYKPFVIMIVAGVAVVALFIVSAGYRAERIQVWFHPEEYEKGYQTMQGLYAIGAGGLFGKGLGESMQKLGYLPEAQNDMIFSIICEELGLFGAICVILLYLLLLWRFMIIASNAKDLYGSLLATGVMTHIALQVVLNIAVVTNTIPNTGITLPFISYGGTSLMILLAEMGLVLNVSRQIKITPVE